MKNYFSIETLLSEILAVGMSIKILIVSNFFKDDLLIHVKGINLLDTVSTIQYCFLKNGPVFSCVLLMHIMYHKHYFLFSGYIYMDPHFRIWSDEINLYFPFMGLGDFLAYELLDSVNETVFTFQSKFGHVPNSNGATMQIGAIIGQPERLLLEVY